MAYRGAKPSMPGVGPLGRNLIVNLERLRHARGLSYRKLAAAMNETARPIPAIGFSRIMAAERRVDVDELVALAAVLQVAPDLLLLPPEAAEAAQAEVPAPLREARNLAVRVEQLLAAPGDSAGARQVSRALRRVQLEIEELLEETVAALVAADRSALED